MPAELVTATGRALEATLTPVTSCKESAAPDEATTTGGDTMASFQQATLYTGKQAPIDVRNEAWYMRCLLYTSPSPRDA